MASCKIAGGITTACGEYTSAGLVSEMYFANAEDVASVTKTSGKITTITMDVATNFYKVEFSEDSGFFTQPFVNTNGNIAYSANIEFRIPSQDQTVLEFLKQLDFAKLVVIVKTRNNQFYYFGEYNPMKKTGGTIDSGTASTDASGVQVILTGGGAPPASEVDGTIVPALLA